MKRLHAILFSLSAALFSLNQVSFAQGNETDLASTAILKTASEKSLEQMPSANVFGSSLFESTNTNDGSSGLNPYYVIQTGDKVALNLWGAINSNATLSVDANGNIFVPNVGPIQVGGLTAQALEQTVRQQISQTYNANVNVYVTVLSATPINVFVSGFVKQPGQYSGMQTDNAIQFLKKAGGIDKDRGSYREIYIQRQGQTPIKVDLYPFLLEGKLPKTILQDGDVILVKSRQSIIETAGFIQNAYLFELPSPSTLGENILTYCRPFPSTSHVALSGIRDRKPFFKYIPIKELSQTTLFNGDKLAFKTDLHTNIIDIEIQGEHIGPSFYSVKKGTRLIDLLNHIPVNPDSANIDAIYLKRKSVAEAQQKMLQTSLKRLSQSVLTAPASSSGEANIRIKEAELIKQFIAEAEQVKPEGIVVLSKNNRMRNIFLEQGDQIIIPKRSDIVNIGGEVYLPQAIVYSDQYRLKDYVESAGGYTDRADEHNILFVMPNGEVKKTQEATLQPGVKILVLPKTDTKTIQATKDMTQILYQLALSAGTLIRIF